MTDEDVPALLAEANRAVVIAAAGCGKTESIAKAVALSETGRQLILTHTHAGVWALRRRLEKLGVPRHKYQVETIAGWSLRLASSYPATSGISDSQPVGNIWNEVYGAATALLRTAPIRQVLHASYAGIYVDEYQDCYAEQDTLIKSLAEELPCRVLGDPLQGIFGFREHKIVDWDRDVFPFFMRLPDLVTPWRWVGNPALGEWLTDVRSHLLNGEAIDLRSAPINWRQINAANRMAVQRGICLDQLGTDGTTVAIRMWPNDCHFAARNLGGRYGSMEEMDCRDLLSFADKLDSTTGIERATQVIEFARECATGVGPKTASLSKTLVQGRIPRISATCPCPTVYESVIQIAASDDIALVKDLLERLRNIAGANVFRRELWSETDRTLRLFMEGNHESVREAAWAARNITRQTGRRSERRIVARTLLIKGLEYEHALVLDADELDTKNLYVALTRGSHQLSVLSASRRLTPMTN